MPRGGLVFTPSVASDFRHAVAPNPSSYSVMPRPIFLSKPISFALYFLAIERGKLGHFKWGPFFGGSKSMRGRPSLRVPPLLKVLSLF